MTNNIYCDSSYVGAKCAIENRNACHVNDKGDDNVANCCMRLKDHKLALAQQ
ncbi:hypothetical protein FHS25_007138 [Rhizobium laguerreae]|uniref:DUF1540 domain-containing protein n=1 Tax=Rhizobium laguerreae TaxID=1076926 RepID=A0AAX2QDL9_9HYPH|nr:hypothetical protein [Rhizobium laguerreae]TCU15504.1 hypothetical protein EV131_11951 [Rhizobium laguerreae]